MVTIKGSYENGVIKMLEEAPVISSQKVLTTFIDDENDNARRISLANKTKSLDDYLQNEQEDLYQEYLKK